MRNEHPMKLLLLALLCAALWGSAFPGIKFVYAEWGEVGFSARLFFAGVRFTIAGLMLFLLTPRPRSRLRRADWRLLLGLALTQTYIQYICFYSGLWVSGGILAALILASGSFWWMLLAPWILKSPQPTPVQWALLAMASIGIVLAIYAPGAGSGDVLTGSVLFLAAAVSGTVAVIIMRMMNPEVGARAATAASLFSGGVLLMLTGGSGAAEFFSLIDLTTGLMTVYLAIVSATAFSIWNWLVAIYSVNVLASYRFLIPLSGMVQSSLFIAGESPGTGIYLGGGLVILAIYFMNRLERRKRPGIILRTTEGNP